MPEKSNQAQKKAPANFRTLLEDHLQEKRAKNPRYSIRALARDLDLSPAFLSLLIAGKRSLNESRARDIAERLGWSSSRQKLFVQLVQLDSAKTAEARKKVQAEIDLATPPPYADLETDAFQAIRRWYHSAILELARSAEWQSCPKWVAQRLRITRVEADLAIERLVRLGLLANTKGQLKRTAGALKVKDLPSKAIREHHKEVIGKAAEAIDRQDFHERGLTGLTIAIDPEKIPTAKKMIRQLHDDLIHLFADSPAQQVYQLSTQFFRLDCDDQHSDARLTGNKASFQKEQLQ